MTPDKITMNIPTAADAAGGNGYLEQSVKAALEAKGYKCQHGSQYNESYWSVTW